MDGHKFRSPSLCRTGRHDWHRSFGWEGLDNLSDNPVSHRSHLGVCPTGSHWILIQQFITIRWNFKKFLHAAQQSVLRTCKSSCGKNEGLPSCVGAPDAGDSAVISNSFLRLSLFKLGRGNPVRPPSVPRPPVTQAVGQLIHTLYLGIKAK